jgi:prepilin-type N-terminal cleavage/methylation domain-containing protein
MSSDPIPETHNQDEGTTMNIHHRQREGALDRGFTLVELLVVITVLGVLAAVIVFRVGGITSTGRASACEIEVREVNTAIQAFRAQSATRVFPSTLSLLVPDYLEKVPGPTTAIGVAIVSPGTVANGYNSTTGVFTFTCPAA